MKRLHLVLLTSLVALSCERIPQNPLITDPEESFITGDGVFILNEGNFTWGNGTISYYSYDSSKIYNDVFFRINERPLGDVPNSMVIHNEFAYIVVNNSGKIEVVRKNSLESVKGITGLISPRNIAVIDNSKAYVTSLFSDSLIVLDLKKNSVSGYINLRRSSESIVISGKKAFVANWYGGDEVLVINTDLDEVIDSIKVGREPESMVIDKNYTLWVLCNGGWARDYYAELVGINTQTFEIIKKYVFTSILDSPSNLSLNGSGDTLYYLEKGVRRMYINEQELPSDVFIKQRGYLAYKLGINPVNGDIFITNAVDYRQNGFVYIFNSRGDSLKAFRTGIIPGSMCFKVQPGSDIE